jgi:hypothetical protein
MARASHEGFAMQNNTLNFAPLSLDDLDNATGGYHDPSGPSSPTRPDGPDGPHQGTAPCRDIGKLLGEMLAKGGSFPIPGRK